MWAVLVALGLGSSAVAAPRAAGPQKKPDAGHGSANRFDAGQASAERRDAGLAGVVGVERDRECLLCHAGVGEEDAPKLDLPVYERSVHGPYGCISCHQDVEDPTIEHELPEQDLKHVDCARCHADDAAQAELKNELAPGIDRSQAGQVNMKQIITEFRESVHFSKRSEFSCARCHDPHRIHFGMTRGEKIDHNRFCLRCHASEQEFRAFVDESPPDLDKAHAWLPNPPLHWRTARCVDCHTDQNAPLRSHFIVKKEQAVQKCEACHTRESLLTRKSERFSDTGQTQTGFINRGLAGQAYVIGATRNRYLDLIAVALSSATVAGIFGHAMIRWIASRRRRRNGGDQGGHHS